MCRFGLDLQVREVVLHCCGCCCCCLMPKGAPNTCCMSRKYIRAYFHRQSFSQAGYHGHLSPVPYAVKKYRVSANQEPDPKDLSSSSRRESEHNDPDDPPTRTTSLASSAATATLSQFSADFDQILSQNACRKLSTVSTKSDKTMNSESRIFSKKRNSLQFVPLRKLSLNQMYSTEQKQRKLSDTKPHEPSEFPDTSLTEEFPSVFSNGDAMPAM